MSTSTGNLKLSVEVVARDKKGRITGTRKADCSCKALAQFIQANILATAESIADTSNTSQSISANTATGTVRIIAGIGTTPAAAFTDYALITPTAGTSGYVAATINAVSGTHFTVTGTISNSSGSTINYSEIGITIVAATYTFLLAHDLFTALPVSDGGTMAVTYTATFT